MLKRFVKKLLKIVLDKKLPPPSILEQNALYELQTTFHDLPILETANLLSSEAEWLSNVNRLRELVLNQDVREFLRWDVISYTMFLGWGRYTLKELRYLKNRPDWNTRYRTAIRESPVGHPTPNIFYPASSGNLIHHSYHVAQFEEKTKVQVQDLDCVLEFGGGYASMCRLFYNLGFHGRYVIFDLPSFSALQRYYLKALGFPVQSATEFVKAQDGIACVSDMQQLKSLVTDPFKARNTMFIATWSLSESPISIRDSVLPLVSEFKSFLIAYQNRFGEVNNVDFFEHWKETVRNVAWHSWQIEHIPGNSYLIGSVDGVL